MALEEIVENTKYAIATRAPIGLFIYKAIKPAIQKFKLQIYNNFKALLRVINTLTAIIIAIISIVIEAISIIPPSSF
jgi:hypothetical protein